MSMCWCWGVDGQSVVVELTAFLDGTPLLSLMAGSGTQTIILLTLDKLVPIALENKFPLEFII